MRAILNGLDQTADFDDGIVHSIFYYGNRVPMRFLLFCLMAVAAQAADTRPIVAAFGDSLSAGHGADPGQSYPDYLQKLIDQDGGKWRVYNAGVSGDTTTDGLERLPEIVALKPR